METNRKRTQVIRLATEDTTPIMVCNKYKKDDKLLPDGDVEYLSSAYNNEELVTDGYIYHHLYFLNDEEIKEGDHWINLDTNTIHNGNLFELANRALSCKKIIATTDTALIYPVNKCPWLPQPSQAFIEKYCKLGGIDEVLVEYERSMESMQLNVDTKGEVSSWYLKVDSHNQITIHAIKDSWTREEVEALTEDAYYVGYEMCQYEKSLTASARNVSFDTWKKKNL